jgi:hypothetical protein
MGFFDRFASGPKPAAGSSGSSPAPAQPASGEKPAAGGGVIPRMAEARAKLDVRDLPGAMAIYQEVLATAGARPDVLVSLSGELGVRGHVRELIELVAPHYDAQRHGPATGLNLLQAFIAVRDIASAQHLLDILFALNRPELEDRLFGFSNAIGELMAGHEAAALSAEQLKSAGGAAAPEPAKVSLASISKPVWFYGLEDAAPHLQPAKSGKLRRVAFAQCSVPGLPESMERSAHPEDELGRFCRGFALWSAETFAASAGYDPVAAVGLSNHQHYVLFPVEWTTDNLRELNETSSGGLDFVVTSALRNRNDDFELVLRIWEVRKFRELKQFATRWTPATADAALAQFHAQIRQYMEWSALPDGLAYAPPASPSAHIQALGATLTQFLGTKGVLAPAQVEPGSTVQLRNARANPEDVRAQLMLVTTMLRQKAAGQAPDADALRHAQAWLATEAAQKADVSALLVKLA